MAKVVLQISYDIEPDKREQYLGLAREMKSHFRQVRKKDYLVYELKGKKNSFVEQFTCNSLQEYDALEDDLDEKSEELVNNLEEFVKDGSARYATLVEMD